jgi:hypothetical protein
MTLKANIQMKSQFTLISTLNKKGFNAICTKILLQMATKVGNKLWLPQISQRLTSIGVMIIGIDHAADK